MSTNAFKIEDDGGITNNSNKFLPSCERDKMNTCYKKDENKDSNLGIFLGIFAGIYYVILFGILKVDGIFFYQFQNDINASAAETTVLYSVLVGLYFAGGPIYGAFFKLLGAKATLLTGAILFSCSNIAVSLSSTYATYLLFFSLTRGIGSGIAILGIFTITGQSFHESLSFVNNFYAAMSSMFSAGAAPIMQLGINTYTWKGIMLITGGILLNMIPTGWITVSLYKKRVEPHSKEEISLRNAWKIISASFDMHLLKDYLFILYCVADGLVIFVRALHAYYIVRYAQSIGIPDQAAAGFLAVYQIMFVATTILVGLVMSKLAIYAKKNEKEVFINTSTVIIIVTLGQCIVSFIPIIWESYQGYLVYTILSGLCIGGNGSLSITIVPEYFGRKRLASALGFRGFFYGILNFIIPPLIGKLIDVTGSYKPSLYAGIIVGALGSLLYYIVQKRIDKRNLEKKEIKI